MIMKGAPNVSNATQVFNTNYWQMSWANVLKTALRRLFAPLLLSVR